MKITKRPTLFESIELDEPENSVEFEDVVLDEPIEEVVGSQSNKLAYTNFITNCLQKEWDSLNDIKSFILTIESDGGEIEDILNILDGVVDEKSIQIGMLNKALELSNTDDDSIELMKQGEEVADEIISGGSENEKVVEE